MTRPDGYRFKERIETSSLPPPWLRSYEHRPPAPSSEVVDARLNSGAPLRDTTSGVPRRVGASRTRFVDTDETSPPAPRRPSRRSFVSSDSHETHDSDQYETLKRRMDREPSRSRRVHYIDDVDILYPRARHTRDSYNVGRSDDGRRIREELAAARRRAEEELVRAKSRSERNSTVWEADADQDLDVFYSIEDSLPSGKHESDPSPAVSDSESVAEDEPQTANTDEEGHRVPAYHVLDSQYDGAYWEGHYKINMTAVLSGRSPVPQTLFRWIHFMRPSMDIDEFSDQVSAIPGLSSIETDALKDMILKIKRDNGKKVQASNGRYVHSLEPNFRRDLSASDSQPSAPRTVAWLCLPYFSLEPYSGLLGSKNPKAFPAPTLLQARNSRSTRERDMAQAVCQLKSAQRGLCFHVSQLWCLVLDSSLLITYGRISADTLCQDIVLRDVKPLQDVPGSVHNKTLAVRYEKLLCLIPIQECQTWLAFVSHFRNYYPQQLHFRLRSSKVKSTNWLKIYELALRSRKKLVLDVELRPAPKDLQTAVLPPLQQKNGQESSLKSKFTRPDLADATQGGHGAQKQIAKPSATSNKEMETRAPSSPPLVQVTRAETLSPLATVEGRNRRASSSTGHHPPSPQGWNHNRRPSSADATSRLAIFTCLEVVSDAISSSSLSGAVSISPSNPFKDKTVLKYFKSVDNHLLTKTTVGDRLAVEKCESGKHHRQEVYSLLDTERSKSTAVPLDTDQETNFERRVSLFLLADAIFTFFFPPETSVPTTSRFWGAVRAIVHDPSSDSTDDLPVDNSDESERGLSVRDMSRDFRFTSSAYRIGNLLLEFKDIHAHILWFNDIFANIQHADRDQISTPVTLIDAWAHIIISLARFPTDLKRSLALARKAKSQIYEGIQTMIAARSEQLQLNNLVPLPFDILSLISLKLAKDITPGLPNISETYGSYLEVMNSDIAALPPDRRFEHGLYLLSQETLTIEWMVGRQQRVIESMLEARTSFATGNTKDETDADRERRERRQMNHSRYSEVGNTSYHHATQKLPNALASPHDSTAFMAESIFGSGELKDVSLRLLQECLKNLVQRRAEFKEMEVAVQDLINTNRNKLAHNKDGQDNAIYAFTVLTAIFLPLSTVASIFGMNSSDVRDMKLGQWAYWATAMPVTVLVIFLGLVFTGELKNVKRWAGDFWRKVWGSKQRKNWVTLSLKEGTDLTEEGLPSPTRAGEQGWGPSRSSTFVEARRRSVRRSQERRR